MKSSNSHSVHVTVFLAILVVIGFYFQTRTPRNVAAAPANALAALNEPSETVEETVTLSPAGFKTLSWAYSWPEKGVVCGPPFHVFPAPDEIAGTVVAGYRHWYDKGVVCDEGATVINRGAVWFDFEKIVNKVGATTVPSAPPVSGTAPSAASVFVKSASLRYKMDKYCAGDLLLAQADWRGGSSDFVRGFPIGTVADCVSGGCADLVVTSLVNNWVKGPDVGGEANYGLLFTSQFDTYGAEGPMGDQPHWKDNDGCLTRYSEISLTVTYKYEKPKSTTYVPKTGGPPIIVGPTSRTNVALAANGGKATASSIFASGYEPIAAINGDRKGIHVGSGSDTGSVWASAKSFPQWLEVDFNGRKSIGEIDLFTSQDLFSSPSDPTETMLFSKFGLTSFQVLYWTSSGWAVVPTGNVATNNNVWKKFSFSPAIRTDKIKILTLGSVDGYSRIAEVEAWTP